MNQAQTEIKNRFDLAALDALLGPEKFISVLDRNASTGCVRYAALTRDSSEYGARVQVIASYTLDFPGHRRQLYTLLKLDLQVQGADATILYARQLGQLVPATSLTEPLMAFARTLADGKFPSRKLLTPFLPWQLLDTLDGDHEETLIKSQNLFSVLHDGHIDPVALAHTLNLAVGECAQMVDVDPDTGDYRVFYLDAQPTPQGGETLTFELHRQGPGFERRLFNVLSLTLGPSGSDGSCPIEAFSSDAGVSPTDLPRLLQGLARIVTELKERRRPEDALVLPFLSRPAQVLWTQPLTEGAVA